jgi:hypothetical protein
VRSPIIFWRPSGRHRNAHWQSHLLRDWHHGVSGDSGKLEVARQIANYELQRTTKLYDRRQDEISL